MKRDQVKYQTSTIAEMTNGIILANFEREAYAGDTGYQTEAELEEILIESLISQGYERLFVKNHQELYMNLKHQPERLNEIQFSETEWERFLIEYLDAPGDGMVEKTRKVQENHIYDFTIDDGTLKNIKIIDKNNIHNNFLQVVNQVKQKGKSRNRSLRFFPKIPWTGKRHRVFSTPSSTPMSLRMP